MANIKQLAGLEQKINNVDEEITVLNKNWAAEIAQLSKDPSFDAYSKKGEKKLAEVAEKYVDLIVDAENRHDELVDEFNKIVAEMSAAEQSNK